MKRFLLISSSILLSLVIVLCIHIYVVTRPKAPDNNTIVMARIDIRQPITQADADHITNWMYQQKGVDHVLCTPAMDNIVFTFRPLYGDANVITQDLISSLHYDNARRYIPTEKDLKGGCPVASTSYTYKAIKFLRSIL
jgi:hypothetical protein